MKRTTYRTLGSVCAAFFCLATAAHKLDASINPSMATLDVVEEEQVHVLQFTCYYMGYYFSDCDPYLGVECLSPHHQPVPDCIYNLGSGAEE